MNVFTGSAEDEFLIGTDSNDSLDGGAGSDTLDGGSGNDYLFGGARGTRTVQVTLEEGYWTQGPDIEREEQVLVQEGYWEQGPDIEREEQVLVQEGYWMPGPDIEREVQVWVPMGSYEDEYGNWIEDGYYDTQIIIEPGAPVWVEPVYETQIITQPGEQVWVEPVYETQIIVEPGEEIWVEPIYGWEEQEVEDGSDYLAGGAGNDTLQGGDGADTLAGGLGNDIYIISDDDDVVLESPGQGNDVVRSFIDASLAVNVEWLELQGENEINGTGNAASNGISGNAAANLLSGGDGLDTLRGGGGNDTLLGGNGNDLLVAGGTKSAYEVIDGYMSWDDAVVDAAKRGGQLATIGTAEEWAEVVAILPDKTLWLGGTAPVLQPDGSRAWRWHDGTPWTFDNWGFGQPDNNDGLEWSLTVQRGEPGADRKWNDERIFGTDGYVVEYDNFPFSGDVSLSGGAGVDTLRGSLGNDTLDGGTGADSLVGGAGNDFYVVENGGDVVLENANEGTDTAQSTVTFTLGADVENLELVGSSPINGKGNQLANKITGNLGNNLLEGAEGADTILGGAGNDTVIAYWQADLVDGGDGNDYLTGGTDADTLLGGGGNDTLIGDEDADRMSGGTGNDLYLADDSADVVVENANEGTDTVRSLVTRTLSANVENLELTGSATINGMGNALANRITGNNAANLLDGGGGIDTLTGGNGNDTYIVDHAGDVVVEMVGFGADSVQSSVTHALGANVEHLVLTGSAAINGTGNALANNIAGNSAANLLAGGEGNDTLSGGDGNDTLSAGRGTDSVVGGNGNDLLVIDWTSLPGAVIAHKVDKVGASFKGVITAKNTGGALLSQVSLDSVESILLNGKSWSPEPPKPGVAISRSSTATATTELGGLVEYAVVLQAAPKENVRVVFSSSDLTEARVNTPTLTFTPQNWDKPQKLVIQGVDDFLDDKDVAYTIQGRVVTDDLTYNRVTVSSINLINMDDTEDKPFYFPGLGQKNDGVDYIQGKNGNDTIYGGQSQDQLRGGRGDDELYGEQDNDRLFGELGNDVLYGEYGGDFLDGGEGSDSLFGEQGRDTLLGGAGNDYLDGGIENDSMSGGMGNDTYLVDSAGDVINDFGATTDLDTVQVIQTISYTLPANIENASITASGNANLTGNTLNNGLTGNDGRNVIDGGVGNDRLDGAGGADSLLGGAGNDVFLGGMGNDTMRGGQGVDVADFVAAGVDLRVDLATGRITGEGTDLIFDIENILAGDGQDTLSGNAIGNDLDGGAGMDSVSGGGGNDTLAGCFFGANGGRNEIDSLTGGAGTDVFQLGWASGRFYDDGIASNAGRSDYALITDFTVGQDRLQLDGAAGNYYLGASGVTGASGIGLYAEQGATDELIAIIRSANSTVLTAANTINTAQFV